MRLLLLSCILLAGLCIPAMASADGEGHAGSGSVDPLYRIDESTVTAETKGAVPVSFEDASPRELAEGETLRRGSDLSEWNYTIYWQAVADSGVEFAIIRCAWRGYGSSGTLVRDLNYIQNIEGAKAAGLLVGAYIFSQATNEAEAREEADFLMELVEDYDIELPLVMDFEYAESGGYVGRLYNANLTKEEATAVCNAFCDEVELYGYDSMVYANTYMLNSHLNREDMGRVWMANYTDMTYYTGAYEYWQFTSSGRIPGISTNVDLNFWFDPGTEIEEHHRMPFDDVCLTDWYYNDVLQVWEEGVVQGRDTDIFAPEASVTRGELVTMLFRMYNAGLIDFSGLESSDSAAVEFSDIRGTYCEQEVFWAIETGLVQGYEDGTFGPDTEIVREDLVLILYRAAGSPKDFASLRDIPDSTHISAYALDAGRGAVEAGLLRGDNDGVIYPRSTATRAEACALLNRFRDYMEESDGIS